MRRVLSPRKILVASLGVATVSYVGLQACDPKRDGDTNATVFLPEDSSVGNLMGPDSAPPILGPGDAASLSDGATDAGEDASPVVGNLMPPPAPDASTDASDDAPSDAAIDG